MFAIKYAFLFTKALSNVIIFGRKDKNECERRFKFVLIGNSRSRILILKHEYRVAIFFCFSRFKFSSLHDFGFLHILNIIEFYHQRENEH